MMCIKFPAPGEVEYGLIVEKSELDRKQHWESVYRDKPANQTSWHQEVPRVSLSMIAHTEFNPTVSLIDVGGGASLLVDHLLDQGFKDLTVLDISRAALDQASARLGARAATISWIETDVTRFVPNRQFDIWHDRAAFHFLNTAEERSRYVKALRIALAAGGQAIIAAFAPRGPAKCSGLDIVRYDAQKLGDELGPEFVLEEQEEESHTTPAGREQLFNFFRFRKIRLQSGNPDAGPIKGSKQVKMTDEIQIDPREMARGAQKASELMKTLGHKDRLMVLCHLISGEKSVGELATLLEISQSPLSQHLARMRKESLVSTRREAQTIYYSITSGEAGRIVALMHELYCSER